MPGPIRNRKAPTEARLKALQGAVMAVEKVMGSSVKEIASRWEVSEGAVRDRIGEVTSLGFYKAFEDAMLKRLVPQALAVVEAHLQMGDYQAAKDVLQGMGVISSNAPLRVMEPVKDAEVIDSLEIYRKRRTETAAFEDLKRVN